MNIIVLGPQGSGKGTQVELLAQKYQLTHFDAGSTLRKEATSEIKQIMERGELVPQSFVRTLLEKFIANNPNSEGYIFDGYPRTVAQYEELKEILQNNIDKVINIEISEEETINRLSARRTCSKCGEIYNLNSRPPKNQNCDVCGGELVQRPDDQPEAIKKRLDIYRTQTHPVYEMALLEGRAFEVNGEQSVEKVFQDILEKLSK